MSNEPQHDQSRLEHAAESTAAKIASRWLTPALITIIGTIGAQYLNEIRATQAEQTGQIGEVKAGLSLLNAKVDYSVIQQLSELQRRVNRLEAERSGRTQEAQ